MRTQRNVAKKAAADSRGDAVIPTRERGERGVFLFSTVVVAFDWSSRMTSVVDCWSFICNVRFLRKHPSVITTLVFGSDYFESS